MCDDSSSQTSQLKQTYSFKPEKIVPMILPPGFSYFSLNAIGLLSLTGVAPFINKTIKNNRLINILDDPNYFELLLDKLVYLHEPTLSPNNNIDEEEKVGVEKQVDEKKIAIAEENDVEKVDTEKIFDAEEKVGEEKGVGDKHRMTMLKLQLMTLINDSNSNLFYNIGKAFDLYVPYIKNCESSKFIPSQFYVIPEQKKQEQLAMTFKNLKELQDDYLLRYFLASDSDGIPTLILFKHISDDESDYIIYNIQYNSIQEVDNDDFDVSKYKIYFMVYQSKCKESCCPPFEIATEPLKNPPSMNQLDQDISYQLIQKYIKYQRAFVHQYFNETRFKFSTYLYQCINPIIYLWSIMETNETDSIDQQVDQLTDTDSIDQQADLLTKFQYFFYLCDFNHIHNLTIEDDSLQNQLDTLKSDYYKFTIFTVKIIELWVKYNKPDIDLSYLCKFVLNYLPIKSTFISRYVIQLFLAMANKSKNYGTKIEEFISFCISNMKDYYEEGKYKEPKTIEDTEIQMTNSDQTTWTPYDVAVNITRKHLDLNMKNINPEFRSDYKQYIIDQVSKYFAIHY